MTSALPAPRPCARRTREAIARAMVRLALAASLAASLVAPAVARAQSAAPATRGSTPPFYRVTAPDGRSLHLLGSIHAAKPGTYPLPAAVERAFRAATVLVLEIDLDSMRTALPILSETGRITDGRLLSEMISPTTDSLLRARLPTLGIQPASVQGVEPWVLALFLGAAGGRTELRGAYGVDVHFFRRARRTGLPVVALESVAFQMGMFDALSPEEQDEMLYQALVALDGSSRETAAMYEAWRTRDVVALDSLLNEAFRRRPRLRDFFLGDRNRHWVKQVPALLAGGHRAFVVVGAGHLVGADGLVALLRAQGYTVTPL